MKLDVGIGSEIAHRVRPSCIGIDIQRTENNEAFLDVLCDATFMPFKSDCFEIVFCSHLLEHVDEPLEVLKEILRVAKNEVELEVPHRLSSNAKGEHGRSSHDKHKNFFRVSWFHSVLRNFRHRVEIHYRFPLLLYIRVYIGIKPYPRL